MRFRCAPRSVYSVFWTNFWANCIKRRVRYFVSNLCRILDRAHTAYKFRYVCVKIRCSNLREKMQVVRFISKRITFGRSKKKSHRTRIIATDTWPCYQSFVSTRRTARVIVTFLSSCKTVRYYQASPRFAPFTVRRRQDVCLKSLYYVHRDDVPKTKSVVQHTTRAPIYAKRASRRTRVNFRIIIPSLILLSVISFRDKGLLVRLSAAVTRIGILYERCTMTSLRLRLVRKKKITRNNRRV